MNAIRSLLLLAAALSAVARAQEGGAGAEHIKVANEKFQAQDFAGAEEALTKALDAGADPGNTHFWRGRARHAQNKYEGAEKDFTAAIQAAPANFQAYFFRGQVRQFRDNIDGAIEDFGAVTTMQTSWVAPWLGRADAYAIQGKYKLAMDDYEAALFVAGDVAQRASVYTSRGRAKLLSGDKKGAIADFEKAVEQGPESPNAYFSRGLFRHDLGQYKEALADLRKCLELDPDHHEYSRLYVCLARLRMGEADAAAKEMGEYLDQRENKDDWFVNVAGFLAGRLSEEEFLKATEAENKNVTRERRCEAYWYAAAKRLAKGEKDKAKELLDQCVANKVYGFIEYASALAELEKFSQDESE